MVAFVDREGGSFFQEWSALFIAEEDSGGRVCFHYPRLSPTTAMPTNMSSGSGMAAAKLFSREEQIQIAKPVTALALHAAFVAMPHTDENDRETVLCYCSYFPARMASVY